MSNDGSQTRVTLDLRPGMTYTLTPTFGGLRLDVQGALVTPDVRPRLGPSVVEYRAGNGQITLITPFPLSQKDGWRASESTLTTGGRVLVLEFGSTLFGGRTASLRALQPVPQPVMAFLPPPPPIPEEGAPRLSPGGRAASLRALRSASQPMTAVLPKPLPIPEAVARQLPPGDSMPAASRAALPAPSVLPGAQKPSALTGRVTSSAGGTALVAPRVGRTPGLTRIVVDLPVGATYTLAPGPSGMRVALRGVTGAALRAQSVSPELQGWRYDPVAGGVTLTLQTPTPLTKDSGWRAQVISPQLGGRAALAIDLSPALANLKPLLPREKVLPAVARVPVNRGTALLAFGTALMRPRVVLDAGHGGKDPGAVGSVVEKQVTLDVTLRVRTLLQTAGVDVVLTRDGDRELHPSKATDLNLRAGMSAGTNLFVSIHVNAMAESGALRGYGIETWWNPNHPGSAALAGVLQKNMVDVTGAYSRGLRSTQSLGVLRENRVPAALVEIGFGSHPVDGLNLKDGNYLDRVALGIARGIRETLAGQ